MCYQCKIGLALDIGNNYLQGIAVLNVSYKIKLNSVLSKWMGIDKELVEETCATDFFQVNHTHFNCAKMEVIDEEALFDKQIVRTVFLRR